MSSPKKPRYVNEDKAGTLGKRLALIRKSQGMTQRELARRVGLASAGAINNYEKGRIPRGDMLHQIATVLRVTVEQIMLGTEMEVPESPDPYGGLTKEQRALKRKFDKLLQEDDEIQELLRANIEVVDKHVRRRGR